MITYNSTSLNSRDPHPIRLPKAVDWGNKQIIEGTKWLLEQCSFAEEWGRFYVNRRDHLSFYLYRMMLNWELTVKVTSLIC